MTILSQICDPLQNLCRLKKAVTVLVVLKQKSGSGILYCVSRDFSKSLFRLKNQSFVMNSFSSSDYEINGDSQ
jgi:hypothetical protein